MIKNYQCFVFVFCLCFSKLFSQSNPLLNFQSFKLKNGLTVFLNEDSTATRVFGAVMVKAGAKNESPDATGMAHYLEHMLFKGTQTIGTSDYKKEKPFLDSINVLYSLLASATKKEEKDKIQKAINEQAMQASKFGLPGELDKLLSGIGSTGINAFTTYEMTFYHNSFPAHEMNKWMDIYSSRFIDPVFRSFQSELEVVYEEKNRAMDNFEYPIEEKMSSLIFPDLPYGQWGVLGKVEHLKKPSLIKMYEFYNKNYVANNMALILSGNFKSGEIIPLISEKFEKLRSAELLPANFPQTGPIKGEQIYCERMTPIKAEFIGFRAPGLNHPDRFAMDVCEGLLFNAAQTGYLDQLILNNQLLYCETGSDKYSDAGAFAIYFAPKITSSLKNVQKKIDQALLNLSEGKFSDEQFSAIKNELAKLHQKEMEDVSRRSILMGEAFVSGISWETVLSYPEIVNNLKREDIMRVAKLYFGKNRVKVISRTGFPKKTKLEKPPYKPVLTDQKGESVYAKKFNELPSAESKPRFVDFKKDIEQTTFDGHKLLVSKNKINNLFSLNIGFKTGMFSDPVLHPSTALINYSGAGSYSLKELKQAFANIGCTYYFRCDANYLNIYVEGNEANLEKCLALTNIILTEPKADETAKKLLLNEIKSQRIIEKNSPASLGEILAGYGMYGDRSFFLLRHSQDEIKKIPVEKMTEAFKNVVKQYKTEIIFSGKTSAATLATLISKNISLSKMPKEDAYIFQEGKEVTKNTIYIIHDKKAVQSQVYFYVPGQADANDQYAKINSFNAYIGGGFSGIVAQEIREYRSLAYSAWASYGMASEKKRKGRFNAFIGCQGDKTNEAIKVMTSILSNMPEKPERIPAIQKKLQQNILTTFPYFRYLPYWIINWERKGLTEDPNIKAYKEYQNLNFNDITEFYKNNIQNKPFIITIYGDKSRINLDELKKIGQVIELKPKDILKY